MKKSVIVTLLSAFAFVTISAQTNKEEVELFQSIFGMEKKAIVAEFVQVEGESGEAFWSLYDQYEIERKELGIQRLALLNEYATNYEQMGTEKMDELVQEYDDLIGGLIGIDESMIIDKKAYQEYVVENKGSVTLTL